MMQFCPKCKAILMPKKDEKGKIMMVCSCGYNVKPEGSASIKEEKKETENIKLEVADADVETLPVTKAECEKCGNGEAYYWLIQTRAGDEAETRFLKCTKCKHTWREYD